MAKATIDSSKEFIKILKMACKNGKLDDEFLNNFLCNYHPYDLTFKSSKE